MRYRNFVEGGLAAALLTLALVAPATAQARLYVANQEDVTVSVIDMASNELVTTVDLKAHGFPGTAKAHATAVEPDGSFWYVSLIAAGVVLKFDRDNNMVGQASFEAPGLLSLDPAADRMYVGRSMAAVNPPQRVGVIRRSTMEIEEVDVFFPRPHAIAVDTKGDRFFSASLGQNSMAYAPLGAEEVDLLNLPGDTHTFVQFAISPDGNRLVATGQMTGDLLVFDITGDAPELVTTLDIGSQPWHPSFADGGRTLWIPNQTGNSVTVVDAERWVVDEVITHPALIEPHGSAVSPDGRTVYVSSRNLAGHYRGSGADERPGTVVAIDARTREVTAVVEVGRYAAGMSATSSAAGH